MKLITYMQQLENAAKIQGVDMKIVARKLGMQSNLSRWLRHKTSPRQAQAERFFKAIHDETS